MRKVKAFVCTLLLLLIVSCSWNKLYSETSSEEYPDMILENASYTYGQADRNPLFMKASKITIYSNGASELEKITFTQGHEEEAELWGSCNSASARDNSVITLAGSVKLHQKEDDISIMCDSLEWNDEDQTVATKGTVEVTYKDGTEITAEGFNAKLKTNEYTFDRIIEGRFTNE